MKGAWYQHQLLTWWLFRVLLYSSIARASVSNLLGCLGSIHCNIIWSEGSSSYIKYVGVLMHIIFLAKVLLVLVRVFWRTFSLGPSKFLIVTCWLTTRTRLACWFFDCYFGFMRWNFPFLQYLKNCSPGFWVSVGLIATPELKRILAAIIVFTYPCGVCSAWLLHVAYVSRTIWWY